jgi:hypothetical protein
MYISGFDLISHKRMNTQKSVTSFFSLTEDTIETSDPECTKISKRKGCGLNYKSFLQFIATILRIIFQLVILIVDQRRSK